MEPNADQPKRSRNRSRDRSPMQKDDLKSLPLPEVHFARGMPCSFRKQSLKNIICPEG